MSRIGLILWALVLMLGGGPATAHESRPLYVEIVEQTPEIFGVVWKIPPSAVSATSPVVSMPASCTASAPVTGTELIKRQLFSCEGDLAGQEIRIDFPGYNPSISTMFRFRRLSGETHTSIQSPDVPIFDVPAPEATASVAKQYLLLGVEHILKGYDHLLFVACLMLIAGSWRRILVTITGFTLAHSVTLALAALGWVKVPVPPVEAAIALSIVFLATEIARDRRDTLTWRYPIAVAVSFGLLHGFGFASVLGEIGLPQTEIPAALFFFNLGVELGQILFVAALIGLATALKWVVSLLSSGGSKADDLIPTHLIRPSAYVIGTLAAFWTIDRIAGFWI